TVDLRDVRDDAGAPFTGTLQLVVSFRRTDSGCDAGPCTMPDVRQLPVVPVYCGPFDGHTLPAGRCHGNGTLNGAVAGFIVPGGDGVIELQDVAIYRNDQLAFVEGAPLP